jgi:hypothetical protein
MRGPGGATVGGSVGVCVRAGARAAASSQQMVTTGNCFTAAVG